MKICDGGDRWLVVIEAVEALQSADVIQFLIQSGFHRADSFNSDATRHFYDQQELANWLQRCLDVPPLRDSAMNAARAAIMCRQETWPSFPLQLPCGCD